MAESAVQVERLEWITKNLLDLSRLDAGLVALDLNTQDAGELIEAVATAFRTTAQEKTITLSTSRPGIPISLDCDRARVELALGNLLNNALKFSPCESHVEIGTQVAGSSVRFWVQDNGPGIDAADQPYIFERFYRGQAGRTEGSGLGLAIVRSVAQAHDGSVWVESELGKGSRFVIELPQDATSQTDGSV